MKRPASVYIDGSGQPGRTPSIGRRWGFELIPSRLDHTVIKVNEVRAAWKWSAGSNIPVIKILPEYIASDMVMERDRDDLMSRRVPTLLLMTSDTEPAHTRLGFHYTFIFYSKDWKLKTLGMIYTPDGKNRHTVHALQTSSFFSPTVEQERLCYDFSLWFDLTEYLGYRCTYWHWE